MIGTAVLMTPPEEEPVTLQDIRRTLRMNEDQGDDDLLWSLAIAAREQLESLWGRAFVTQTWDLYLDAFPCGPIEFPNAPLVSIEEFETTDVDGNVATVDPDLYVLDTAKEPGRLVLAYGASWPSTTLQTVNGVRIRFVAGRAVDAQWRGWQRVRLAICQLVAHWHEFEGPVVANTSLAKVPNHIDAIGAELRVRY